MWIECYRNLACHLLLCAGEKRLDITHNRIEILPFVQPVAVKLRELVLPAELPLGEYVLLQGVMCFNDKDRRRGFETDASFNPNNSIANMNIATNAVRPCQGL